MSNQNDQILKTINCHNDMIYSLAINRDGSLLATTSKDRKLRIIEPRTGIVVSVSLTLQSLRMLYSEKSKKFFRKEHVT